MMKRFLGAVLSALLVAGCAGREGVVTLKGRLADVPDSTRVYLLKSEGNMYCTVADTLVVGGRFRLDYAPDSTTVLPAEFVLSGEAPIRGDLRFWAGAGVTRIEGEGLLAGDWHVGNRTAEQAEFARLYPRTETARARENSYAEYLELLMPVMKGEAEFDSLTRVRTDALRARFDSLWTVYLGECYAVVKDELHFSDFQLSQVAQIINYGFMNGRKPLEPYRDRIAAQYEALTEEQRASADGELIHDALWPVVVLKEGDALPQDPLQDLDGGEHRMAEFRGKYLLLDFWSSGCQPCIASIGELGELAEKYADRLSVVSISVDESAKLWREASQRHGISWSNLSDGKGEQRGFAKQFGITGVPFYVLADADGVIVKSWSGYGEGSLRARIDPVMK